MVKYYPGSERYCRLMCASTHNRAIEDRIIEVIEDMRKYEGVSKSYVSYKCGVSDVSLWKWLNGRTFPKDLGLLRTLVGACGGELHMKIVAPDGEEFII